jgi:SynChlorMet cassette radical SAM/SPASM protein ScmF
LKLPLVQLYMYLTEGCNLACRHCWLAPRFDPNGTEYRMLPVEVFETAIREAKPLGLQGVKLTGGEPLLHPQFVQLLEIARREDVKLTIETNGLLCTDAIAAEIAKSPSRFVSVSIDGADAAAHEWVRGVPGSFEQAKEAVRRLVAHGTSPQIIMSLVRNNVGQVEAVVRMAEELGASSVKFNVIQPTARGEKLTGQGETLSVAELIELGRYVESSLAATTRLTLYFDYPLAFKGLRQLTNHNGGVCGIKGILGVIPSGHYALCGIGEHVPELVFGKVGDDPLEVVWQDNPILEALREGVPDQLTGVCGRCLMKSLCLGACIAQNYYRARSLWAPFWFCEEAEQAALFPVTRLSCLTNEEERRQES